MNCSSLSKQLTIDGYRGIWFELGHQYEHGDRYSGGLGTYTANHQPMAVYSEKFDKTFFTYGGTPSADQRYLLIMAGYYDHKTGEVSKPVVVCDKQGVDDPHDNASIQIDAQGRIWVFVSGRGVKRPGYIFCSREPGCIDVFECISEQEVTYPEVWLIPNQGFFLLFTKYTEGLKGPARELFWKTSSDGFTWSRDHKLAGFGGHYQVSGCNGVKLATFFNWHPESDNNARTNIYYLESSDGGRTWTNAAGAVAALPLDQPENMALVADYRSAGQLAYTCDLNFDAEGNPILLYVRSRDGNPGPQGDPREWCVTHWDGKAWQTSVITISTHNYDMGSLYVEGDLWRVIAPTDPGKDHYGTGGEISIWESRDQGAHWLCVCKVTEDSEMNHGYVRRPLGAKDPFYAFWADGNPRELSSSRLYFCDSSGELVFELPYDMEGNTCQPQRVSFNQTQGV
ncbi:BNR-4 repeat-containing protein [Coraliomargarita parva]|uniref:BNR-4 repeat-containing protein n=1 Tax=Coraliomargarita parva TaxID=3014050 RepID=UPI0022B348EB|nr:BNR-4 repeat-containing protein [Coraliomargarita parva]